jgi:hypothetical protein
MESSSKVCVERALELMQGFADRTGLSSRKTGARYLWTDAYAVCNFLHLGRVTADHGVKHLAFQLIDRVHHALGQHRADDTRDGWLSGLSGLEGERHPTRGGLRIGKPLPERLAREAFRSELEWDRDGQYFHYLTPWMYALDRAASAAQERSFNRWARELAETAIRSFKAPDAQGRPRGLFWKMSIDLSRPLVPSLGAQDPLDGLVTCLQLQATATRLGEQSPQPALQDEVQLLAPMLQHGAWVTEDALGAGGLLVCASRLGQLVQRGAVDYRDLLERVVTAAAESVSLYAAADHPLTPAAQRLAFRELGLAIGLSGLDLVGPASGDQLVRIRRHSPLVAQIQAYWLDESRRAHESWAAHRDINDVMLATALVPESVLTLD